jgi:starch synthase
MVRMYIAQKAGPDFIDFIKNAPAKFAVHMCTDRFKLEFKYNNFVLTTNTFGSEGHKETNAPDIKANTKTYFEDGKIYYTQNKELLKNGSGIYDLDKKGTFYFYYDENNPIINNNDRCIHHSYFLKGKVGEKLYGYGRPLASAGHADIKDGKILFINNRSGHYLPNADQLKLATHHLMKQNVVDDNLDISFVDLGIHWKLSDIQTLNIVDILGQYSDLDIHFNAI